VWIRAHSPLRSTLASAWLGPRWRASREPAPVNGNRGLTTVMSHARLAVAAVRSPTRLDNPYTSSPTYG
jgi:hypothetical protein